jgi:glycerophosphoryl diester phosphodiesterase
MQLDGGMPRPIVIGHRGVPGHRLEHTRPSYELAIAQGADFIEPDVVATRDGVLVVRHENEISGTTDVADRPELADRKVTKVVDGVPFTGWFTEDLTLAELRTVRVRERLPDLRPQNLPLAGQEPILTFEEVLAIAAEGTAATGREIGVYVETKHPTHFAAMDLDLGDLLLADLERHGRDGADAKIFIQSKETGNLQRLRDRTPLPLIQLMDRKGAPFDLVAAGDPRTYADLTTPERLAEIAEYADGIGPNKSQVIARHRDQSLAGETGLVARAHAAGLLVHIWTMRDENNFLPRDLRIGADRSAHGDAVGEYLMFYDAGVDGVFSDFTATAVQALDRWDRPD